MWKNGSSKENKIKLQITINSFCGKRQKGMNETHFNVIKFYFCIQKIKWKNVRLNNPENAPASIHHLNQVFRTIKREEISYNFFEIISTFSWIFYHEKKNTSCMNDLFLYFSLLCIKKRLLPTAKCMRCLLICLFVITVDSSNTVPLIKCLKLLQFYSCLVWQCFYITAT